MHTEALSRSQNELAWDVDPLAEYVLQVRQKRLAEAYDATNNKERDPSRDVDPLEEYVREKRLVATYPLRSRMRFRFRIDCNSMGNSVIANMVTSDRVLQAIGTAFTAIFPRLVLSILSVFVILVLLRTLSSRSMPRLVLMACLLAAPALV